MATKRINLRLAYQRGLSEEAIHKIQNLYKEEEELFHTMEQEDDPYQLRNYAFDWYNIQTQLQAHWGFPLNENYHRWWNLPKCTCPKMDNDDAWPTGRYYMSSGCPIHDLGGCFTKEL